LPRSAAAVRHAAYFHELDAWTEYWDLYHPESHGRFYFGDGADERGLLTRFLPRQSVPPAFAAWTRWALRCGEKDAFVDAVRVPDVADAVTEVDALVARLFASHFGDPRDLAVQEDYLEAVFLLASDALPPATERDARVADDDPRKSTAGRHTIEGDVMWFAWALEIEAAHTLLGEDEHHPLRALLLAGVATGCPANFAWRGHRRTREEYRRDTATTALLRERGLRWASDFASTAEEVGALYRIREWGCDE
jgi:hypothetical protein